MWVSRAAHQVSLTLRERRQEHDLDGNGKIELDEFAHMVRKFLEKPCAENCLPCARGGTSHQTGGLYSQRCDGDGACLLRARSLCMFRFTSCTKNRRARALSVFRSETPPRRLPLCTFVSPGPHCFWSVTQAGAVAQRQRTQTSSKQGAVVAPRRLAPPSPRLRSADEPCSKCVLNV